MPDLPDVLARLIERAEDGWDDETHAELAKLAPVEVALGYTFRHRELLRAALTLESWCNEHKSAAWSGNGCLEFFGDAVLGVVAADVVWNRFPERAEGDLTRLRSRLVSEAALAGVARDLDLGPWLYLGRGDEMRSAGEHNGTLADAFEAVLGAVFLDTRMGGGDPIAVTRELFGRLFGARLDALEPDRSLDPKSLLQHRIQADYRRTPVYIPQSESTEGDEPRWRARVVLNVPGGDARELGEGTGRSLRAAEVGAARDALDRLDAADGKGSDN